jgi:hypothetical protein
VEGDEGLPEAIDLDARTWCLGASGEGAAIVEVTVGVHGPVEATVRVHGPVEATVGVNGPVLELDFGCKQGASVWCL